MRLEPPEPKDLKDIAVVVRPHHRGTIQRGGPGDFAKAGDLELRRAGGKQNPVTVAAVDLDPRDGQAIDRGQALQNGSQIQITVGDIESENAVGSTQMGFVKSDGFAGE